MGEITINCVSPDTVYKNKRKDFPIALYNIGWGLKKELWNQGFVTEAAKAVTDFVETYYMDYCCGTIYAECDAENIASRRVMEKIGMVKVFDRFVDTAYGKRKWNCYVKNKSWSLIAQISCHHCDKANMI